MDASALSALDFQVASLQVLDDRACEVAPPLRRPSGRPLTECRASGCADAAKQGTAWQCYLPEKQPGGRCLFQDLLELCDWKLLLGGVGVETCGTCDYSLSNSHYWQHKKPLKGVFKAGATLELSCWHEFYAAVPREGLFGQIHGERSQLTCSGGDWVAASSFACAACVQLVRAPYADLQKAEKQERPGAKVS